MADEGTGTGTQEGTGTGTQEGAGDKTGSENDNGNGNSSSGSGNRIELPAEAQALVDKTIKEAKEARDRAAAAEAKVKKFEDAQLSEQEKAAKALKEAEERATAAEAKATNALVTSTTTTVAAELGFRNPALAKNLIDRASITFDKDGQPDNIKSLLQAVAKSDPYLVGKASGNGGAGSSGDGGGSTDMNDEIRRRAGR